MEARDEFATLYGLSDDQGLLEAAGDVQAWLSETSSHPPARSPRAQPGSAVPGHSPRLASPEEVAGLPATQPPPGAQVPGAALERGHP